MPRDPVQLGDDAPGIVRLEMMQELRARDDIYASVRDGEVHRITYDRGIQAGSRSFEQRHGEIEPHGRQGDAFARGRIAGSNGDVRGSRSDVEENRSGRKRGQRIMQSREHGPGPAKEDVRSCDVGHGPIADRVGDTGIVEELNAATTRGSPPREHQRSS